MENSQDIESSKASEKLARDENGRLLPGQQSLNPLGRPAGQSLKEFWRQRLSNMTEQEKLDFSKEITKDMVWRMGEGQPKTDVELSGEVISKIVKLDE